MSQPQSSTIAGALGAEEGIREKITYLMYMVSLQVGENTELMSDLRELLKCYDDMRSQIQVSCPPPSGRYKAESVAESAVGAGRERRQPNTRGGGIIRSEPAAQGAASPPWGAPQRSSGHGGEGRGGEGALAKPSSDSVWHCSHPSPHCFFANLNSGWGEKTR